MIWEVFRQERDGAAFAHAGSLEAAAVAVRYDGFVNGIDDEKQIAEKTCAARGKTARLRRVSDQGLGQHYGYFECVSTTGLN